MLIGLGIGGGMGTAWCIGAIADDSGDIDARAECAEGFTVFPGLGALIGLAVDAVIPGKVRVAWQYRSPFDKHLRASGPQGDSRMIGVIVKVPRRLAWDTTGAGPREGARQGQGGSVPAYRWAGHSAVVNEKGFP